MLRLLSELLVQWHTKSQPGRYERGTTRVRRPTSNDGELRPSQASRPTPTANGGGGNEIATRAIRARDDTCSAACEQRRRASTDSSTAANPGGGVSGTDIATRAIRVRDELQARHESIDQVEYYGHSGRRRRRTRHAVEKRRPATPVDDSSCRNERSKP